MSDQPVVEETVPIPPKNSGGGNKVLLIILGVAVACMLLFGIVLTAGLVYVKNRGANIVKDIAKTQGVDVKNFDAKNGAVEYSVKTEDGEITSKISKELPDDYPTNELPVYDGVITSTNRMNMGGNISWVVKIDTDDARDVAADKVKQDMKDHGWEILMEREDDDTSSYTAKKGDRTAAVSLDDHAKEKTTVMYSVIQRNKEKQ